MTIMRLMAAGRSALKAEKIQQSLLWNHRGWYVSYIPPKWKKHLAVLVVAMPPESPL